MWSLMLVAACSPTAAPVLDTGTAAGSATSGLPPEDCPDLEPGWQEVGDTRRAPYVVHHPDVDDPDVATLVFLPGGSGEALHAELTRASFLDGAPDLDAFRVVMPVSDGAESAFDPTRVKRIRAEVLECFGGDPDAVHLAGHSNGGLAAFETMVQSPDKWASLLTVPGAMDPFDADAAREALGDTPVYLGVGELDTAWLGPVEDLHRRLTDLGVDAELTVFEGLGHIPEPGWPGRDELFAWWRALSP